jgi:hypothetical protein
VTMLVNGQNIHVDFTVTMNLFWQGTLTDGRVIAVKQLSKAKAFFRCTPKIRIFSLFLRHINL